MNTADHRQKQSHRRKSPESPPQQASHLVFRTYIHQNSFTSPKSGRERPQMPRRRSLRPCTVLPRTSPHRRRRSFSYAAISRPLLGTLFPLRSSASVSFQAGRRTTHEHHRRRRRRQCRHLETGASAHKIFWAEQELPRRPLYVSAKRPLQCRSIRWLAGPSSQSSRPTLSLHLCRERSATVSSSHME